MSVLRWAATIGLSGLAMAVAGCGVSERLNPLPDLDLSPSDVPPVVLPTRVAFGSCSDPRLPMETLDVASELEPELYLWLGDNIYADTVEPGVMRARYAELADAEEFTRLRNQAHLLATWDDHDYGANDAGADYVMKAASREIFLEFWQEPIDSERWERDGIYTSYRYEDQGHVLQIILLDTRFHRDPLTPDSGGGKNDYVPSDDDDLTILGEAQWLWLEQQFLEPADLRIVASSIQFAHEYNGYESWTLFPRERDRFVSMVRTTQANGVVLLSGDVHWGEISRLVVDDSYDLYDITSSGINQDWPFVEVNGNRVGEPVAENNVGLIDIDWSAAELNVTIYDRSGTARLELPLSFDQLR